MKKKIVTFVVAVVLFAGMWPTQVWAEKDIPKVDAEAAILMDMTTGEVLYEKNADKTMEPASLTKVMTGLLALENLKLDDVVTIEEDMDIPGNGLGLKKGESLTVKDLLYGMLVYSANDAAVVLAEETAGSIEAFNEMAINRAEQLGATHTVYKNPNGLNNVSGHVTTARDLALISIEAMKNETFQEIVSTASVTLPATALSEERKLTSTNRLLYDTKSKIYVNGVERTPKYDGVLGIKTGETSTAGLCLIAAAQREGTKLVAVILNSSDTLSRFEDGITLLDYGFNNYYTYEAIPTNSELPKVKIANSSTIKVSVEVPGGYSITLPKEASSSLVTQKVQLAEGLSAPLKKGQEVGTIDFYLANEKIGSVALVTASAVKEGGPWTRLGISDLAAYILMGLVIFIFSFLLFTRHQRKKRRKQIEKRRKMEELRLEKEKQQAIENKRKRDWPY